MTDCQQGATMKVMVFLLPLVMLLAGCEKPAPVDYALLVERDGITYMAYGTDPFTSDATESHENGKLKMERHYVNGRLNGFHREWYDNGQLRAETTFKDGKEDGLQRKWHENGQLSEEQTWKDGELDGLAQIWYYNGQLQFEAPHRNGELDGLFRSWHKNGQMSVEETYKDGLRDGLQTIFPEDPDNIFNILDPIPPKCFASGKEVDIGECAE
jgi:antitoxin component YwqK of YwqJK toxin-antitoxin module